MDDAHLKGFQWPPAPVIDVAPPRRDRGADEAAGDPARSGSWWMSWWWHVERVVLAPTVLPARRAMVRFGRDDPSAYCGRCGATVGPFEQREFGCGACHAQTLRCERVVRLGAYEGDLAKWVGILKFQKVRPYGEELGRRLGIALREAGVLEGAPPGGVVVQPTPMSWRRRWSRGIDHAAVVARAVGAELGVPVAARMKREHRPSQLDVPAGQREANVRGTIRLRRGASFAGVRVVLVDDVRTTGATLEAAARGAQDAVGSARPRGPRGAASVWGAVVSVTPREGE